MVLDTSVNVNLCNLLFTAAMSDPFSVSKCNSVYRLFVRLIFIRSKPFVRIETSRIRCR